MLKQYRKFTLDQRREFNKLIAGLNYRLCRIIMLIIAGIEAFLVLITLIGQPISDIGRPFMYITDYLYLWCFLVLLVFCLLVLAIVFFVYKNPDAHTNGIRAMTMVFSVFICAWSVCISLLDYYYYGYSSPIVMLIVFMALAGALHMYPWESLALFAASFLCYLVAGYVIASQTGVQFPPAATMFNVLIFLVIAAVISFTKFENRVRDFLLGNTLQCQNTKLSAANEQLLSQKKQLEYISITDRLTGIRNRWAFTTRLKEVFEHCKNSRSMMTVALFDLDDFKMVNDKYGHSVGDECLVDTSEIFKKHVPSCDLFRYGGEEFVIIFQGVAEARVNKIIEGIRRDIESTPVTSCALNVTISGGQFSYVPVGNIREDRFVINADRALYLAKRTGKNKIEVYKDIGEVEWGANI